MSKLVPLHQAFILGTANVPRCDVPIATIINTVNPTDCKEKCFLKDALGGCPELYCPVLGESIIAERITTLLKAKVARGEAKEVSDPNLATFSLTPERYIHNSPTNSSYYYATLTANSSPKHYCITLREADSVSEEAYIIKRPCKYNVLVGLTKEPKTLPCLRYADNEEVSLGDTVVWTQESGNPTGVVSAISAMGVKVCWEDIGEQYHSFEALASMKLIERV